MHLSRIAALAAIVGVALSLTPINAANAYTAVTIETPDVSTPGHVKVRLSGTDAPYVSLTLGQSVTIQPTSAGYADFDLVTWGYESATLSARPCAGPFHATCSTPTTQRTFTASQSQPVLQWPDDSYIGPYEYFQITVIDPKGDGILKAVSGSYERTLSTGSPTSLHFEDGYEGSVAIYRCSTSGTPCAPTGQTFPVSVNSSFTAYVYSVGNLFAHLDGTTKPDAAFFIRMSDDFATMDSPVTLNWNLEHRQTGQIVKTGTTDFSFSSGNEFTLSVDMDGMGLPDGDYMLNGTVSASFPKFGVIRGALSGVAVTLDQTAPHAISTSGSKAIYPFLDGYKDVGYFDAWGDDLQVTVTASVLDSQGRTIRTLRADRYNAYRVTWDGRAKDGTISYGENTVVITLTDAAGNSSEVNAGVVTVYPHRLESRVWTKRVKGRATMARWAGRCSTFKSPSSHGWKKSLALNSRTKCNGKTWSKSGIVAAYGLRLPSGISRYTRLRIRTFGAAGRSEPRSLAYVYLWNAAKQRWKTSTQLGSKARYYSLKTARPQEYVADDHTFVWRVLTGGGARYDVKDFTVEATYPVLRDPTTGTVIPLRAEPGARQGVQTGAAPRGPVRQPPGGARGVTTARFFSLS